MLYQKKDVEKLFANAKFDLPGILELEKETKHDIVAFTRNVSSYLGDEKKWVHYGLTSTDVVDTAYGYLYKQANDILYRDLLNFQEVIKGKKHYNYKFTPCIGRTHGVHADISSFGLKFALYYDEFNRHIKRFNEVRKIIEVGKISGAVGTFSNTPPEVQDYVCAKLGIESSNISTQTLQRDRHADYYATLALIASSIEKIGVEIRHLQRTEVREAEEYFSPKQKGSSAMPHKRNPITCERICGMARLLRGYAQSAYEDQALWHERDISHSSVERVILPDATISLNYMLHLTIRTIDKLLVYPETMLKNLNLTGGLVFSQTILTHLVDKGAVRDEAYRWVQKYAMERWLEGKDFATGLKSDENIKKYMTAEEIDACFDPHKLLKHVDTIMARFGL